MKKLIFFLPFFFLLFFQFFPVELSLTSGDAAIVGSIASPRTFIPILASDSASSQACAFIFNGLVKYDKDLILVGDLAKDWSIEEEGKVIVFHLHKGVRWHDGVEFTAKDVEFTYKTLVDPNTPTPYSGDFERIESLEIIDDYTLKVIYKEPFAPALSSWGMSIIPKHLLEKEDNLLSSDFAHDPIGTGPYIFKRWVSQEKVELRANPDYFEHRPNIDRAIIRVIPDTATMFLEVLKEGIDNCGLTPLQYLKHTQHRLFNKNYKKFRYPSNGFLYLGYNLANPLFKDERVRRALTHAVDREEIIRAVILGEGIVSTGPLTPESWAYNSEVKPFVFSPEKALKLFKQAGWTDSNNDGILDKESIPFKFTIITNQGNLERQKVAEIIQARLKEVGVKVEIKIVEWSVFIDEVINKRKFEVVLLAWSLSRDPDLYDIFHSSKTKEGEFNFIGYKNQEVDRLLIEGRREFDLDKRRQSYQRIQELIYQDQPYMFLYVPNSLSCIHKRFEGVEPSKGGYWYNFIDWWVAPQNQKYKTLY